MTFLISKVQNFDAYLHVWSEYISIITYGDEGNMDYTFRAARSVGGKQPDRKLGRVERLNGDRPRLCVPSDPIGWRCAGSHIGLEWHCRPRSVLVWGGY